MYSPCTGDDEAAAIGEKLVNERLAACVNIIPRIRSIYRWQGELVRNEEAVLIAKTPKPSVKRVIARIRELHSYELPSITAFCQADAEHQWQKWVTAQVK